MAKKKAKNILEQLTALRAKYPKLEIRIDNDCFCVSDGADYENDDVGSGLPDLGPEELVIELLRALGFDADRV